MGFLHTPELLIIVVVALIFLGPKRLPEAGRGLGRAIRGFKDETQGMRDEFSSLKSDTQGIHTEVRNTVEGAVRPAVTASPPAITPVDTAHDVINKPLPVGSNEELLSK